MSRRFEYKGDERPIESRQTISLGAQIDLSTMVLRHEVFLQDFYVS